MAPPSSHSGYVFTSSADVFITFSGVGFAPPPQPQCLECTSPARFRRPDGRPVCERCAYVIDAAVWLDAAFRAIKPEQRSKLYRSLSTVFHPDAGGDERLMQALNAVKERFP